MNFLKKNLILLITALIFIYLIVELTCYLLLNYSEKFQYTFPYFNQQISPYYVFENAPGFKYKNCIKSSPNEPDVVIDQYGFISEAKIEKQKDTNAIRIFITGGSGAFGSGQIKQYYGKIKSFPLGLYSYESSIAGLLQKKLKKVFPSKNIEVVNACAVKRMLHQSVAYYLETISDFNPDFVISIDGNNDIAPICGFSPYLKGSIALSSYIELYEITKQNQNKSFFNIINLINKLKINNLKTKEKNQNKNNKGFLIDPYASSKYNDYIFHKEKFIRGSEKFLNLIKYYHSLCETDNVKFIFCLQPLLYRQKFNKKLSLSENTMQKNFYNPNSETHPAKKILSSKQIEIIRKNENLILKYFIDDYLSDKINQISIEDGFSYIDMNKELMSVPSNIDVFVDYCHLTPDGNEIVAEILLKKINTILNTSKNNNSKIAK